MRKKDLLILVLGLIILIIFNVSFLQPSFYGLPKKAPVSQKITQRQEIRTKAAPDTTLYLSPASLSVSQNQTFSLTSMIETGTNIVPGVELHLVYNPAVFSLESLQAGPSWSKIFDGPVIDNTAGTAFVVVGNIENPVHGTANVVTFNFKVISSQEFTERINFSPETKAAAWTEEGQNVIISLVGTQVSMVFPTSTPIPTATPKPTSTPLPTATPTLTPTPTPSPTPTPTVTPTPIPPTPTPIPPTPTPTLTPTPSPSITPTPQPTTTPIPPTPTLTPTATPIPKSNLVFKVKFQGINSLRTGDRFVRVILRQIGVEKYQFPKVTVLSDANGIFSGTISEVDSGNYDILVKGWAHLQKKWLNVSLTSGLNQLDWSASKLLTGDAHPDNVIDIYDITAISQDFGSRMPTTGSNADFDLDGDVDIFDLTYMSENFNKVGEN